MSTIPFIDLQAQRARISDEINAGIAGVLEHGRYIMGPEVGELEGALAEFCGATHVVSCSSGTDALMMALMAKDVGPGDAVIVPTFTFAATAEAPALLGATPVFADVLAEDFNIDPASAAAAIRAARDSGLKPKALIAVDLFGQPADYAALRGVCEAEGVWILDDAAQSWGAAVDGRSVGTLTELTATSFFPAKPLGCYGDGGAVATNDDELAVRLRSIRVHGKGTHKYDNTRIGLNARLDTLQAAILLPKLRIFADELTRRQELAEGYADGLRDVVEVPTLQSGRTSAWAQYTICVDNRDKVQAALKEQGVPSAIYYPRPLHQQTAYRDYPRATESLPVSERLSQRVLSLPFHPYMDAATRGRVIEAVRAAVAR